MIQEGKNKVDGWKMFSELVLAANFSFTFHREISRGREVFPFLLVQFRVDMRLHTYTSVIILGVFLLILLLIF